MDALILGAGYATRLYPLTQDRPKPLLPVGGVPILERICGQLGDAGAFDAIHVVTNHRFAGHYYNWLRDYQHHRALPVAIEIFDDLTSTPDDRLGAIGDIQFVIEDGPLDDDVVVIAGDNLISAAARRKAQRHDFYPGRPRFGGPLLEEELAVDAVRVPHQDVRPSAGAA